MRAFILLTTALLSCADPPSTPPPEPEPQCTEPETMCDPSERVMGCEGGQWRTLEDCGIDSAVCVIDVLGDARCAPPAEQMEHCGGAGQGSCAEGLVCADVAYPILWDGYLCGGRCCMRDCSSGASVCDDGEYCEHGRVATGGRVTSTAVCLPLGARNDRCFPTGGGCAEGLSCVPVAADTLFECKQTCDAIGTSPPECQGQRCLGYLEREWDGIGNPRSCTTPSGANNCSPGYSCLSWDRYGTLVTGCARHTGICGNEVPIAPPINNFHEALAWTDMDARRLCGFVGTDQYCGVHPAADGNAVVECVDTNVIGGWGVAVFCNGPDDFESCIGLGDCAGTGQDWQCNWSNKICVSFCTSPDGQTTLDCGTGYDCVEQGDWPMGATFVQQVNGVYVTCDPADAYGCDTANGFACTCSGDPDCYCTKLRKICVPSE